MDRLDNAVRRYAWGSANDIPEFLGLPPDGGPQAELWMGAHPSAPSMALRGGESRSLRELIAEDPDAELGPHVAVRYGGQLSCARNGTATRRTTQCLSAISGSAG